MQRTTRSNVLTSHRSLRAILLPILAYVALPLPAAPQGTPAVIGEVFHPNRVRHVQHFPLGVNWGSQQYSVPVTIPKFDPALGTLLSVDVKFTVNTYATIAWENTHPNALTGHMGYDTQFEFRTPQGQGPYATFGNPVVVSQAVVRALPAYDGTTDGSGSSGLTIPFSLSAQGPTPNSSASESVVFQGGAPGSRPHHCATTTCPAMRSPGCGLPPSAPAPKAFTSIA